MEVNRNTILLPALLASVAGTSLFLISIIDLVSQKTVFFGLTIILIMYIFLEAARVRRQHNRWLLIPVLFSAIITFLVPYGITNILYVIPDGIVGGTGALPEVSSSMVKIMWLSILGSIALWLGYWSPFASIIANSAAKRKIDRFLDASETPRRFALPLLLLVSLASRLTQIKLGIFGYSSNYEKLIEMGSVTQYFSMISSLGVLALVVSAIWRYSNNAGKSAFIWFYLIFIVELFFGFLSGFKSQVAIPFVIAGVCMYLYNGRISKRWILYTIISLIIAYAIIEPFRVLKNSNQSFQGTSVTEIVGTYMEAINEVGKDSGNSDRSTLVEFLERSSLVSIGSLGIDYSDSQNGLPEGSPDLIKGIIFSPIYALVPRIIWNTKPVGDLALWYTQVVVGQTKSFSATAMGAVTYFYLAGGAIAVVIGFFCFGVMQKIFFVLFRPNGQSARTLVYLGILPSICDIGNAVDGTLINLFRIIPIILIIQYFIYARTKINRI